MKKTLSFILAVIMAVSASLTVTLSVFASDPPSAGENLALGATNITFNGATLYNATTYPVARLTDGVRSVTSKVEGGTAGTIFKITNLEASMNIDGGSVAEGQDRYIAYITVELNALADIDGFMFTTLNYNNNANTKRRMEKMDIYASETGAEGTFSRVWRGTELSSGNKYAYITNDDYMALYGCFDAVKAKFVRIAIPYGGGNTETNSTTKFFINATEFEVYAAGKKFDTVNYAGTGKTNAMLNATEIPAQRFGTKNYDDAATKVEKFVNVSDGYSLSHAIDGKIHPTDAIHEAIGKITDVVNNTYSTYYNAKGEESTEKANGFDYITGLTYDLGSVKYLNGYSFYTFAKNCSFEAARMESFDILLSKDGVNWTVADSARNLRTGGKYVQNYTNFSDYASLYSSYSKDFTATEARYVRLAVVEGRGDTYANLINIGEIEMYETSAPENPGTSDYTPAFIVLVALVSTLGMTLTFSAVKLRKQH